MSVKDYVLVNAGPYKKDPVDTRIISNARNGKGAMIVSQADVGGIRQIQKWRRSLIQTATAFRIIGKSITVSIRKIQTMSTKIQMETGILILKNTSTG